MSEKNSICQGCPAAYALYSYAEKHTCEDGARADMQRNEARKAKRVLEAAAGQTACRAIIKDLPMLPETVPAVGTSELISLVAQYPSFDKYIELRHSDIN